MRPSPTRSIPQLVVYHRNGAKPRETLQLESAQARGARRHPAGAHPRAPARAPWHPTLQWEETAPSVADPLEDVDSGQADYAIIDEREFSFAHHLYPDVLVGFALPEKRPVQWMVRHGAPDLLASVNTSSSDLAASGRLPQLVQESSGDTRPFAYEESREFQAHVTDRLPQFRPWFEAAAAQSGIDWRLLAAVGYQESKWDPRAASDDGARRGHDADRGHRPGDGNQGSHRPGAEHRRGRALSRPGAREDSRTASRNPTAPGSRSPPTTSASGTWRMRASSRRRTARTRIPGRMCARQLPLLAQERWYDRAKRGYARGWEPVQFVDRIQRYLTLLEWQPGEARPRSCAPPSAGAAAAATEPVAVTIQVAPDAPRPAPAAR